MRDIVTTIQAEQDAIIRLPLSGVVVIEGGPGTGKTAVALHRVAYLLYTHRERLARSGVLVVGPSAGFIRYVGGVLPALGESAVVFTTPGRLAHGVVATAVDQDEVARTKGGLAMLDVLRRAVADRQELPGSPIAIELDDVTVEIDRATAAEARRRARATGLPHNAARATFRDTLGSLLVSQGVERLEQDLEDPPELADLLRGLGDLPEIEPAGAAEVSAEMRHELRDDLRSDLGFHAAVERLWPVLTPEQVLAELFASPERLASAGGEIDVSGLHRAEGSPWTVADAPLLDELAELLGPAPADPAERAGQRWSTGLRRGGAEHPGVGRPPDRRGGSRRAAPDRLRHRGRARRPAGGRAPRDASPSGRPPTGTGGTGISSSTRRRSSRPWTGTSCCGAARPRSITAVGDLAQRSAPAGAREWADVLAPHLGSRWTYRTLTVNYRTPAEIMALAAGVLAEFAPDRQPPESVRATGEEPWQRTVPASRPRRRGAQGRRGGGGAAGPRDAGGDRRPTWTVLPVLPACRCTPRCRRKVSSSTSS